MWWETEGEENKAIDSPRCGLPSLKAAPAASTAGNSQANAFMMYLELLVQRGTAAVVRDGLAFPFPCCFSCFTLFSTVSTAAINASCVSIYWGEKNNNNNNPVNRSC